MEYLSLENAMNLTSKFKETTKRIVSFIQFNMKKKWNF